jgi:hypothetical protein
VIFPKREKVVLSFLVFFVPTRKPDEREAAKEKRRSLKKKSNLRTMYWSAALRRSCASAGSTSTLPVYTQRIIASKTGQLMFGIGISDASFSR